MSQKGESNIGLTSILLMFLLFSLFWGSIKFKGEGYNADCTGLFEVTIKGEK